MNEGAENAQRSSHIQSHQNTTPLNYPVIIAIFKNTHAQINPPH